MKRMTAGRYAETYRAMFYEVFRDRVVAGTELTEGWRYQMDGSPMWSSLFAAKYLAVQAARAEIDSMRSPQ